ncbi:MAG: hypothetical protein IJ800_01360, partial [Clostridia bacterium]|nr:hypothetical protein [Clostridia bacterium]
MRKFKLAMVSILSCLALVCLFACGSSSGKKDDKTDSGNLPTMGLKVLSTGNVTFETVNGADYYG